MKICFFSTQRFEPEIYNALNQNAKHDISYFHYHLNRDSVAAVPKTDVVCCFVNDKIDRYVIDALKERGVRLIALRSAGYNHVDCAYALQQGIPVCRVPAYSPYAVAEHTMALILCLNRNIHRAHNRVREGNFALDGLMGFDLHHKTIGIIGTGHIGSTLAHILHGFGCQLLAYDIKKNDACMTLGVQYVDLKTLLKTSDIISLHCPLNEQTRHMINQQSIALMKPRVMLINTSRGKLIETKAIIKALKEKRIGYLGLDVYEEEDSLFFEDHSNDIITDDDFCRLQTFPNVLITGHQAFFTKEAVHNIAETTLTNISHFEQGITSPCFNWVT